MITGNEPAYPTMNKPTPYDVGRFGGLSKNSKEFRPSRVNGKPLGNVVCAVPKRIKGVKVYQRVRYTNGKVLEGGYYWDKNLLMFASEDSIEERAKDKLRLYFYAGVILGVIIFLTILKLTQ